MGGNASSNLTGVFIKRGAWDTDTHRRKIILGQRENMAIYEPRREASE